ncbi:restriction of telomere capping protein 5 [[Candida] anglica]|uniref:Restriction of telomere capping protein 5 n=1 Tax=[Candida] anglica TaxID=148631 RepID=A0ABP0EL13_9ASCO
MGQSTSISGSITENSSQNASTTPTTSSGIGYKLESFTKSELIELFYKTSVFSLGPIEMKSLLTRLNCTSLENQPITVSDMAGLFELPNLDSSTSQYGESLKLLFKSFRIFGKFPFIQDSISITEQPLTTNGLINSIYFHSGRYSSTIPNYDYLKLIFISLVIASKEDNVESTEKNPSQKPFVSETLLDDEEQYVVEVGKESPNLVNWQSFNCIKRFDDLDVQSLKLPSETLVTIITLFLILSVIDRKNYTESICLELPNWSQYEVYAKSLVKFIDLNLSSSISFDQFKLGIMNGFPNFLENGFKMLFTRLLIGGEVTSKTPKATSQQEEEERGEVDQKKNINNKHLKKFPKFIESRLINKSSLSLFNAIFEISGIQITKQNLIKLYSGSEAGFSIRSLESKIFKWQAPTIFLVSGKRLKNKTLTSNKRYQQFSEEYPRFFRNLKDSKRDWQLDNDQITYAVIINQPWKSSNKNNFGDEKCTIVSISPRYDIYTSVPSSIHMGRSIYFNNLGLGLGFGNDQPINKNGIKKYLPGDTSLTIEANLEFATFRHISTPTSNTTRYFQKSKQAQIHHEDFEDRFMITDLEVWGIGSTKELEEQQKQWDWENKQAEARQSVNLKNMGEERAFLEMVGLVGNHGGSGGSV